MFSSKYANHNHKMVHTKRKLLLLILMLFCCFGNGVDACLEYNQGIGRITPDQITQLGKPFHIDCTLISTKNISDDQNLNLNSSHLIITRNHRDPVDTKHLRILNNQTLRFSVEKSTFNDTGTYYCDLKLPNRTYFICLTKVTVGYPPLPVPEEDFECKALHMTRLRCSWKPQNNHIKTTYNLSHLNEGFLPYDAREPCPDRISENSCEWTHKSNPAYQFVQDYLYLILESKNELGHRFDYFNITHSEIIEPPAVQNIKYSELTANKVLIQWDLPQYFGYASNLKDLLRYELQMTRYSPQNLNETLEMTTMQLLNVTHIVLNKLVPFSIYNVSLACRISTKKHLWSKKVFVVLQTPQDRPYKCPTFMSSSFESTTSVTGDRSITLYWSPVRADYENAPGLGYRLTYEILHPSTKNEMSKVESINIKFSNVTSHTFDRMQTNASFLFKIYSFNIIGQSECHSELFIDRLSQQPVKPSDLTVFYFGDGGYEVKWKHSRASQIKRFVIFWCPNVLPRPFLCKGVIQSKIISNPYFMQGNEKRIENFSHMLALNANLNYQFSIAAENVQNVSSGLFWASCIIPKKVEKLDKINDFRVEAIGPHALEVTWKLQCPAMNEVIKQYEISYCELPKQLGTDCQPLKTIIVDKNKGQNLNITELESNTFYRVSIRAVVSKNIVSEETSVIERTYLGPPSSLANLFLNHFSSHDFTLRWISEPKKMEKVDFFTLNYGDQSMKLSLDSYCHQRSEESKSDLKTYDCMAKVSKNVNPNTDYVIQFQSCVTSNYMGESRALCSNSTSLQLRTEIDVPGKMHKPYVKLLNRTAVLIEWNPPEMRNGDLNYFKLHVYFSRNHSEEKIVNANFTELAVDCFQHENENNDYPHVKIAAVNLKNGSELIGEYSAKSILPLCNNMQYSIVFNPEKDWLFILAFAPILFSLVFSFRKFNVFNKIVSYFKRMDLNLPEKVDDLLMNFDETNKSLCESDQASLVEANDCIVTQPSQIYGLQKKLTNESNSNLLQRLLLFNEETFLLQSTSDQIEMENRKPHVEEVSSIGSSHHCGSSICKSQQCSLKELDGNSSSSNDSGVDVCRSYSSKALSSLSIGSGSKEMLLKRKLFMDSQMLGNGLFSSVPSLYERTNLQNSNCEYQHTSSLDEKMTSLQLNELRSRMSQNYTAPSDFGVVIDEQPLKDDLDHLIIHSNKTFDLNADKEKSSKKHDPLLSCFDSSMLISDLQDVNYHLDYYDTKKNFNSLLIEDEAQKPFLENISFDFPDLSHEQMISFSHKETPLYDLNDLDEELEEFQHIPLLSKTESKRNNVSGDYISINNLSD